MLDLVVESDRLLCRLRGRLDTTQCWALEDQLMTAIRQQTHGPVILDMSDVDFVCSAFLRICLSIGREIGRERLCLTGARPVIQATFKIAGLAELLP